MAKLHIRWKAAIAGLLVLTVFGSYLLFLISARITPSELGDQSPPLPLPPTVSAAEICPDDGRRTDCWIEVTNQKGCYVWISSLQPNRTLRWNGECSGGLGEGTGELVESDGIGWSSFRGSAEGSLVQGLRQGRWIERYRSGFVGTGTFVDGKKHGTWIARNPGGAILTQRYMSGKAYGGLDMRDGEGEVIERIPVEDDRTGDYVLPLRGGGEESGRMEESGSAPE